MSNNTQWGSRLGFILASAGSAIGLGAIWKFPFWAGANGGGAFIIPYVLFTFTIGVALVAGEIAIGRHGRGSAVSALRKTGGKYFAVLGGFSVLTAYVILSYYSVVGGWCFAYLVESLSGSIAVSDANLLKEHFGVLVTDGASNVGWHLAFLSLTCATVVFGIQRGIERVSKFLMPTLFVLMLAIIARCLTLPGAAAGVEYLFDFSWEDVTSTAVLNAMGFTFFSLSLGAGILVTYGSYLSKETCIPNASLWVAVLAVQASLLAGLMIMPAVFAFGLEPDAGPGLVFITVPLIFSHLPAGDLFALLFYVCLLVAALTSSVSLLEVVVSFLQNEWHLTRAVSVVLCWVTLFVLGSFSALSFGVWSNLQFFGQTIFDLLDFVCTNVLMPVGGLTIAVLAGWTAWPAVRDELTSARPYGAATLKFLHAAIAVLAPILVLVTIYQGLFA